MHVRRALEIAEKLLHDNYWVAVDFIAHTLVGVRKTEVWLLWFDDYFVYRENKTGFLHYFRSPRLSEVLSELGLRQGFMIDHRLHSSEKYLLEQYHSYASARRIHYVLKELGWIMYGEPLLLEVSENHLAIRELTSGKTLLKYRGLSTSSRDVYRAIVYPGEHVDEGNEETYFYRPSNLY